MLHSIHHFGVYNKHLLHFLSFAKQSVIIGLVIFISPVIVITAMENSIAVEMANGMIDFLQANTSVVNA